MDELQRQRSLIQYRKLPLSYITSLFPSIRASTANVCFSVLQMVTSCDTNGALTYAVSEKFLKIAMEHPDVGGVFIPLELFDFFNQQDSVKVALVSEKPDEHFFRLHNDLFENTQFYNGMPNTSLIPKSCYISPHAIIEEGVIVGENCVFMERCIVKRGTVLGNSVKIKEGAIVGAEISEQRSFGGKYVSIRHDAGVIIGDDVEIGQNTIVSRGLYGRNTTIGNNTRICANVFVTHCCQIGNNVLIAGGASLSGSVKVGDNVWIGPGVLTTNGIEIGNGANISLGSVVAADVKTNEQVTGNFAIPHVNFMRNWIKTKKK